jgi:hypothetical protein
LPPEGSARAVDVVSKLVRPLDRFLQIEASNGIFLLACAIVALG